MLSFAAVMFERYNEGARRVIFFARYEASQFGSPYIETEHLLLGLLRQDKALMDRFLPRVASAESIRTQIEERTLKAKPVSTSVDLPLSNECKRVLAYAAEEAERLSHKHIGTEHLLLGLLREEKSFAAEILRERGLRLNELRKQSFERGEQPGAPAEPSGSVRVEFVDAGGTVIANVRQHAGTPVPRAGERLVLTNVKPNVIYRVHDVEYEYRQAWQDPAHPLSVLEKIRIIVTEERAGDQRG